MRHYYSRASKKMMWFDLGISSGSSENLSGSGYILKVGMLCIRCEQIMITPGFWLKQMGVGFLYLLKKKI
jgi:hypothetical protein